MFKNIFIFQLITNLYLNNNVINSMEIINQNTIEQNNVIQSSNNIQYPTTNNLNQSNIAENIESNKEKYINITDMGKQGNYKLLKNILKKCNDNNINANLNVNKLEKTVYNTDFFAKHDLFEIIRSFKNFDKNKLNFNTDQIITIKLLTKTASLLLNKFDLTQKYDIKISYWEIIRTYSNSICPKLFQVINKIDCFRNDSNGIAFIHPLIRNNVNNQDNVSNDGEQIKYFCEIPSCSKNVSKNPHICYNNFDKFLNAVYLLTNKHIPIELRKYNNNQQFLINTDDYIALLKVILQNSIYSFFYLYNDIYDFYKDNLNLRTRVRNITSNKFNEENFINEFGKDCLFNIKNLISKLSLNIINNNNKISIIKSELSNIITKRLYIYLFDELLHNQKKNEYSDFKNVTNKMLDELITGDLLNNMSISTSEKIDEFLSYIENQVFGDNLQGLFCLYKKNFEYNTTKEKFENSTKQFNRYFKELASTVINNSLIINNILMEKISEVQLSRKNTHNIIDFININNGIEYKGKKIVLPNKLPDIVYDKIAQFVGIDSHSLSTIVKYHNVYNNKEYYTLIDANNNNNKINNNNLQTNRYNLNISTEQVNNKKVIKVIRSKIDNNDNINNTNQINQIMPKQNKTNLKIKQNINKNTTSNTTNRKYKKKQVNEEVDMKILNKKIKRSNKK